MVNGRLFYTAQVITDNKQERKQCNLSTRRNFVNPLLYYQKSPVSNINSNCSTQLVTLLNITKLSDVFPQASSIEEAKSNFKK